MIMVLQWSVTRILTVGQSAIAVKAAKVEGQGRKFVLNQ